jgi:hypothetical protein
MIGYLFCDVLEIAGGVSMCFGVKRLFTVHGLHRLPGKCARKIAHLWQKRAGAGRSIHPAPARGR